MSHLPQELVDAIVDVVDPESLKSCAYVSAAFLVPSRRRIFCSISISQDGRGRDDLSIQQVHSALTRVPHIASYIRNVTVLFYTFSSKPHPHFEAILGALTHIECLVLRGSIGIGTEIAGRFLIAFSKLLTKSSFNRLYLRGIAAPHAFMALAMSRVRTVLLQHVSIIDTAAGTDELDVDSPRLEQLILPGNNDLDPEIHGALDFIMHGKHLPRLRRLALGMIFDPAGRSHGVLAHTASTLEYLELYSGDTYHERPTAALNLPLLPALQSLELRIHLGGHRTLPLDIYFTVAALPATAPHIHTLAFVFSIDNPKQTIAWATDGPFALFDSSAAYRTALPHLRRVRFRLLFREMDAHLHASALDATLREFVAAMEVRLPALRGTRMLEFETGISMPAYKFKTGDAVETQLMRPLRYLDGIDSAFTMVEDLLYDEHCVLLRENNGSSKFSNTRWELRAIIKRAARDLSKSPDFGSSD
ncbi:hypothetical protein C8R44DRAFT_913818 [Mycena epipterygia]|nr:hypothetical protein C8R44DRAFT_913818 [Mycena epipterygia]